MNSKHKKRVSLVLGRGVLNPVPIAPAFNDDTDLTIAVNLGGPASQDVICTNDEKPLPANGFDHAAQIIELGRTKAKECLVHV